MPGTIGEPRRLRNLRERLMPPRANCLIRSRRELFLILYDVFTLFPFPCIVPFTALRFVHCFVLRLMGARLEIANHKLHYNTKLHCRSGRTL